MLGQILRDNREKKPMIHCMVNLVTANDCANLVLASGASPIMAQDSEEVAQVTAVCDGLVLNLGTPSPRKIQAMLLAGLAAKERGIPVVFDPVGVGCSDFRAQAAREILQKVHPTVIRGNASEIRTLLLGTMASRGVDAEEVAQDHLFLAKELAQVTGAVVVLSGDWDIVTDGTVSYRVGNGHPMMRSVTGTGCQMSALIGAYAAANPDKTLCAALAGVCAFGLCGEIAFGRLGPQDGNATYRNYLIDGVYHLTEKALEEGAKYEIC